VLKNNVPCVFLCALRGNQVVLCSFLLSALERSHFERQPRI
jgi:hypothetical protein